AIMQRVASRMINEGQTGKPARLMFSLLDRVPDGVPTDARGTGHGTFRQTRPREHGLASAPQLILLKTFLSSNLFEPVQAKLGRIGVLATIEVLVTFLAISPTMRYLLTHTSVFRLELPTKKAAGGPPPDKAPDTRTVVRLTRRKEEAMVDWASRRAACQPSTLSTAAARMFQDVKVSGDLNQEFKGASLRVIIVRKPWPRDCWHQILNIGLVAFDSSERLLPLLCLGNWNGGVVRFGILGGTIGISFEVCGWLSELPDGELRRTLLVAGGYPLNWPSAAGAGYSPEVSSARDFNPATAKTKKYSKRASSNLIGRLQLQTEKVREEENEEIVHLRVLRVQNDYLRRDEVDIKTIQKMPRGRKRPSTAGDVSSAEAQNGSTKRAARDVDGASGRIRTRTLPFPLPIAVTNLPTIDSAAVEALEVAYGGVRFPQELLKLFEFCLAECDINVDCSANKLNGGASSSNDKATVLEYDWLTHCRYAHDPPEFLTLFVAIDDANEADQKEFHIGY
uniref:DUF1336 domain-containing protein n=1 Tax=Macrostomum lignano TaxID=282301 RepID=A0A1I8JP58_9PLAT